VWTTCNGRGRDERLGAQARSRVYKAVKGGGTFGDIRTKRQVMEWYIQAQDARS